MSGDVDFRQRAAVSTGSVGDLLRARRPKKILVLGSTLVSKRCVEYLLRYPKNCLPLGM